ncbi:MAG: bifunctional (p)ppGpp synthetase/guanosine-3',5'-bis(diphosphate) 3'-pyrophosphohydrolase [Bacteroidia bacterium]|nr:bifunctional (p)ppGpp synthetase/guanosine-3',5'-bis(diphosphate) 3'-pyrophosphohydrolase [Bacteroidia bacterium]NNJ54922.1 bifunctional (p)ppGpp synthetase/guanosine-3',5'-bis(diphosphate) 3'-pyrophosphohydrolase [Bacteroidia bacterium]
MQDNSEENKEIVSRYKQLLRVSKWSREKGDVTIIRKAFETALDAHKEMRRKSGEPYIFHPLAVARIAAEEIGLGTTSIVCALLHDVVEDTDITLADIEKDFGKKVANIIDGLTKISGVFDTSSPQAENFRKMLLTMADDVRVILIKLCDRLHNMRTLEHMSDKGQLKIASETSFIYAPLAHRLGLYAIKTELEDLSLKYTQPFLYQELKQKLNATKEQRNRYIRSFIKPIKLELDELGVEYEIKGRPKSIHSIYNKMVKKKLEFEDVYDLFAIRVIMDSDYEEEKMDCWNVYSIVTSIYKPNPERLRDWISIPKSNGYESLHATVMGPKGQWVEVQIRTKRMDEIAEKGYAAHWKYKQSANGANSLDKWLHQIREVLEIQESNALEFLDEFKMNLYADEVFAFTPKGMLRKLPKGSTSLDFAFDIHTEIGAKCLGAKVNGKLVPLSYEIKNGDQIEILTSAKQKPNKDWLAFVKTTKARTKIKQSLKDEKRVIASLGKESLERKLKNAGYENSVENMNKLIVYFKAEDELELTYQIGVGTIDKEKIKLSEILIDSRHVHKAGTEKETTKVKKATSDELILGDANVELEYSFAKCCNPIPGDKVVGFITVGGEIKIHQTKCKNALNLMSKYGYRIIKAKWATDSPSFESFEAALEIRGIDSLGLVSKVTDIVSKQLKVNMKSISFESLDGTFVGKLTLQVADTEHLDQLMSELKSIDEYINVNRVSLD